MSSEHQREWTEVADVNEDQKQIMEAQHSKLTNSHEQPLLTSPPSQAHSARLL